MEDKIQAYRQPLVTATGIILGFLLNFVSTFVKSDSPFQEIVAYIIGVCTLIGIICLIIVLNRVLRFNYPKDRVEEYYQKTLNLFIFGVSTAFIGVLIDMFAHFMAD